MKDIKTSLLYTYLDGVGFWAPCHPLRDHSPFQVDSWLKPSYRSHSTTVPPAIKSRKTFCFFIIIKGLQLIFITKPYFLLIFSYALKIVTSDHPRYYSIRPWQSFCKILTKSSVLYKSCVSLIDDYPSGRNTIK